MNLIKNAEQLFVTALETLKAKNADYAVDNTGIRNFIISADVAHITASQGVLARIMDKINRIGTLLIQDRHVSNETIFDTIQDAINYLAILHTVIDYEKGDDEKKSNEGRLDCDSKEETKD